MRASGEHCGLLQKRGIVSSVALFFDECVKGKKYASLVFNAFTNE